MLAIPPHYHPLLHPTGSSISREISYLSRQFICVCQQFNPYLTANSALRGDHMGMLPGKTMLNPAAAMMVAGAAAAGHHNKGGSGVFNPWSHQVTSEAWLPSQQFWNSTSEGELCVQLYFNLTKSLCLCEELQHLTLSLSALSLSSDSLECIACGKCVQKAHETL